MCVAALQPEYLVYAIVSFNALNRADPRELLVTTQSSERVLDVRDRVLEAARRVRAETGRDASVTIDSSEGATFPWAWYFRRLDGVGYLDLSTVEAPPAADVIVMTDGNRARLAPRLRGFEATSFPFRVWWVRDYGAQTPAAWARWMVGREPWNPPGGMTEWLLVNRVNQ